MWKSYTRQFDEKEIWRLQQLPVPMLAEHIANGSPVVALRCLAEILLNGDLQKLTSVLIDPRVNAKWQAWQNDFGVNVFDQFYAAQISAYLTHMSSRRVGSVEARLPDLPVLHVQVEDLNYPNYMNADDTSLWVPYRIEPGTRIILRCDQISRPYFPSSSYYEPGTVTRCNDHDTNGRYLIDFQHDPWPPTVYLQYNDYRNITYRGVTEFKTIYHKVLEVGSSVVLKWTLSGDPVYVWGEVIVCQKTGYNFACQIRVLPGQI